MALVSIDLTPVVTRFGNLTGAGGAGLNSAFDGLTSSTGTGSATLQFATGVAGYVGTPLTSSRVLGQAKVYGTNNNGFILAANPSVTLDIYGKLGSDPTFATDGTLLATTTFTDTANESAGRTFTITNTGTYDRVWVRVTHTDATSRTVAITELQVWESVVVGNLAAIETGGDTAAFDGDVVVAGSLIVSEVGDDTAAFTGVVTSASNNAIMAAQETGTDTAAFDADAIATGNVVATETGSDTAAFSSAVTITGNFAAVETGVDTAALSAAVIVSGSLAVTEVGADVAAFTGVVPINGALAVTEAATPDAASFSGTVVVSGTLAATEIGTDTASFTGVVTGFSTRIADMAAQETGTDTAAFSGKTTLQSSLDATETGADTAAFIGKVTALATFAASEIGVDLAAFSGTVTARASLIAFETGVDSADFSGVVPLSGTFNATEVGNDTAAFDGVVGSKIADLNATEIGQDTAKFFGTVPQTVDKPFYRVLTTAASTGGWQAVIGGGYIWTMTCDDFNGAICVLQAKGPDADTPMRVAVTTSNAMIPINIAEATEMRVQVFGRIYNGWSDLRPFDIRSKFVNKLVGVPVGCETVKAITSGILVTIRPSKTDSRIQDIGPGVSFGDHVIGFPSQPNGKLWIHFNGYQAKPYLPAGQRYVGETWGGEVMSHGYTFIDLAYANDISVNEICNSPQGKIVDNAAGNMRLEIITGAQVSPLQTVKPINSINHRVEALLNYVANNNLPVPDVRPFDWSKVYISGHSQGGGHTQYIAKHFGCIYATHLAGPYDVADEVPTVRPPGENIADWYFEPLNVTPKERMGAFLTTHDRSYQAFTGAYQFLGWPKDVMWFAANDQYYIDDKGKLVDGHGASLLSIAPSCKEGRSKASFERIALL